MTKLKKILRTVLLKSQSIKWYLTMQVRFKKEKKRSDGNGGTQPPWTLPCCLKSRWFGSLQDSNKKILTSFLKYQRQGSNWTLDNIGLTINVANLYEDQVSFRSQSNWGQTKQLLTYRIKMRSVSHGQSYQHYIQQGGTHNAYRSTHSMLKSWTLVI